MGLPEEAATEESDNGLRKKQQETEGRSPSSNDEDEDESFERARMVAKAREIKTSPSETQAVWDPAAFMAGAFRSSSSASAAASYGSPSETRADLDGLLRRRREEDAEDEEEGDMRMVDTSPSETRGVGWAEVEAATMRAQVLAVSSSPSDTKAVRMAPEPPLPLLVASSPSETAAVLAEEAASPLLFFSEGEDGGAVVEAGAEAAVAAEQEQEEEQQQQKEEAQQIEPQSDIVADMLLMNGDGF